MSRRSLTKVMLRTGEKKFQWSGRNYDELVRCRIRFLCIELSDSGFN